MPPVLPPLLPAPLLPAPLLLLAALLACSGCGVDDPAAEGAGAEPTGGGGDEGPGTSPEGLTLDGSIQAQPDLSELPPTAPDLTVDVLIIGGGPAGLSAAWAADQAGAAVLVVEREEVLGGAGRFAKNFLAAGSRAQADHGFADSPAALLAEWEALTGGGDPTDPHVVRFAEQSAATVDWLLELGASLEFVGDDRVTGSVPRIHELDADGGPVGPLAEAMGELAWTQVEATSLRVDPARPDRVAGAFVEDLVTGEILEIAAATTVVATGGFARDPARVEAARPELVTLGWLFEANFGSDGGGHGLLEALPVGWHGSQALGMYLHSAADPRPDYEFEALVLPGLHATMVVDESGLRVGSEDQVMGFLLYEALAGSDSERFFALYPDTVWQTGGALSFHRMLTDPDADGNDLEPDELIELGVGVAAEDADEVAEIIGAEPSALRATLARYEELVLLGEDVDFHKLPTALVGFGDFRIVVVELAPAAAKSFGGVDIDLDGRVLDEAGAPVPGLYAAGEVAGLLGSAAVGAGISGSITSTYMTGRQAGETAAAEALAAP